MLVADALHILSNQGVKTVFRKTGHKAAEGQMVKSLRFASLLCSLEGLVYAIGFASVD